MFVALPIPADFEQTSYAVQKQVFTGTFLPWTI